MVVFIALTSLAWARFRERHVVAAAYHAAAFLALAVAYSIAVVTSLQQAANLGGLGEPENVQVLVFAVARLAAAILFVLAGLFTRRPSYGWNPTWILVAPTLAVFAAALVGAMFDPPPDALLIITFEDSSGLPHITPFGAAVHLTTSALFFVGAYVSRDLWHAGHSVIDGWIAVGLVFAGFAELHWVLYPSAHPGQVSTADLLRPGLLGMPAGGDGKRVPREPTRAAGSERRARGAARRGGRARGDRGAHAAGAGAARRAGAGPVAGQAANRRAARDGRPARRGPASRRGRRRGHRRRARRCPRGGGRPAQPGACRFRLLQPGPQRRRGPRGPVRPPRRVHLRGRSHDARSRRGARPRSCGSPRRHCPTSPATPTPPWSACAS